MLGYRYKAGQEEFLFPGLKNPTVQQIPCEQVMQGLVCKFNYPYVVIFTSSPRRLFVWSIPANYSKLRST